MVIFMIDGDRLSKYTPKNILNRGVSEGGYVLGCIYRLPVKIHQTNDVYHDPLNVC